MSVRGMPATPTEDVLRIVTHIEPVPLPPAIMVSKSPAGQFETCRDEVEVVMPHELRVRLIVA
jgi:hypothetical protein